MMPETIANVINNNDYTCIIYRLYNIHISITYMAIHITIFYTLE